MVSPVYIRSLLALLVIAAIIGLVTVVSRSVYRDSAPVKSTSQQLPHNIDVALKKARFSEIKDGQVIWELVAERVNYDKRGDTAYLSDIKMVFQHDRSHGAVTVTADTGEYAGDEKNVRLNGHVHVVTEDGASFITSSIVYRGASTMFSTADPVTFRQEKLQLTAVGMDLNVRSQRARFFSTVDAVIISR